VPEVETQGLELEERGEDELFADEDGMFDGKDEEADEPEAGEEDAPGKTVVPWMGRAEPHKCPACGARILMDRMTKACVVMGTRPVVRTGDGAYQDREMKCMHCMENFIARGDAE
jgi:DNA-directed RNA polymerase subunit RPC12/RpoP